MASFNKIFWGLVSLMDGRPFFPYAGYLDIYHSTTRLIMPQN